MSALALAMTACNSDTNTDTQLDAVNTDLSNSGWELIWQDEFDGNSLDLDHWTLEVNCDGGGNNEAQCYTDSPDNAFVADGLLNIVALPAAEGAAKPYTSARLISQDKADFRYGRIEMRGKLPTGQGAWPAFWMMPTDSVYGIWPRSGEIDIMEAVNLKTNTADGVPEAHIYGTLHYGKEWPNNDFSGQDYLLPEGMNPADDFHTYAVEWQEGEIRWYVDDYLYATQRQSQVRYNSKDEAVGLAHKGWYTEYYDQSTGEKSTVWSAAPFDQDFYLILNYAVGGNWPEAVNETGIDASAFHADNRFQVDYIRVYQCSNDRDTGAGCETVRPGYDDANDALVEGKAPAPIPPSTGIAQDLVIFNGSRNANWPAWDCCGGSTPDIITDLEQGEVYRFTVGEQPTVNGFISRAAFVTDGTPTPFDASPMIDNGTVSFLMKVVSAPLDASASWLFKMESNEGDTAVELPLTASIEGAAPVVGQWQRYRFSLQSLADAGLDLAAIDVLMVFPAWGLGNGAEYLLDEVQITGAEGGSSSNELTIFADDINPNWPMWDCCGGSTPETVSDDAEHGIVSQFSLGAQPTVMGYINRAEFGGSGQPFDGSAMVDQGVIEFDFKLVDAPIDPSAAWLFKVESNHAETAVELNFADSVEGSTPVVGEWQRYTFPLSQLAAAGLDVSAIDVLMMFPAWGLGEGAVYRVDNVKIHAGTVNSSTAKASHARGHKE